MNSAMEGMENLPEEQRDALLQKIEELQVRDRYRTHRYEADAVVQLILYE